MSSAMRTLTAAVGILAGAAGMEHGIGEILQGSKAPSGWMIQSWPDAAFFRSLGGEPALTIVPNLLASGILSVLLSAACVAWAVWIARARAAGGVKHGGLVLGVLAVGMLLVGGGIFPPVLAILAGVLAGQMRAPLAARARFATSVRDGLGKAWPAACAACMLAWLLLFPGLSLIGYVWGINDPRLTVALILLAFGALLAAVVCGLAHDRALRSERNQ
jgi:hypothetical protein